MRKFHIVFLVAAPMYVPTNDTEGFSFSYILYPGCYFHSMTAVKRYPIVVFIWISQIISDVEYLHVPIDEPFHVPRTLMVSDIDHVFTYLPFVCLLFSSLCPFLFILFFGEEGCLLFVLLFICISSLCILDINQIKSEKSAERWRNQRDGSFQSIHAVS